MWYREGEIICDDKKSRIRINGICSEPANSKETLTAYEIDKSLWQHIAIMELFKIGCDDSNQW